MGTSNNKDFDGKYDIETPPYVDVPAPPTGDVPKILSRQLSIVQSDTPEGNASVNSHGWMPKLSGSSSDSLKGDGTWGKLSGSSIIENSITNFQVNSTTLGTAKAFVSTNGDNGDYTNINSAIAFVNSDGGGEVFIRNGVYNLTSNVSVPSNVTLQGETSEGVVLDFLNQPYQLICQGSNTYTTGTVSATNNSVTVTGSGTTWTSGMVGQSIYLSGLVYVIVAVNSATNLTIDVVFEETTFTNQVYAIATPLIDITVSNMTVQNSTATTGAVYAQYTNASSFQNLNVLDSTIGYGFNFCSGWDPIRGFNIIGCDTGVNVDNAGAWSFKDFLIFESTTSNMTLNRMVSCEISNFSSSSSSGSSIVFTNCAEIDMYGFTNITNGGKGIELTSCSDIELFAGSVKNNSSDGLKLTATNTRVSVHNISFISNTGYGINIAAISNTSNIITACFFSGNGSGTINDLGANTVIAMNSPSTPLPVSQGGTGASTASITSFNNITGYTASGATGTTSTNLVFSTSPTLTTPALGTPSALVGTNISGIAANLTSGITNALKSATTTVDVSAATAPTSGQVLTATAGTTATWQTPSGSSIPKLIISTTFEGSGRFNDTQTGSGTVAYGTLGMTLDTSATSGGAADNQWTVNNYAFSQSPSYSICVSINTSDTGGTGDSFFGLGHPSIDGTGITYTSDHIGFKIMKASAVISLYATQADGTETASSALTTLTNGDRLDLVLQVNGTSSVDYYWRKNGGALSSATNLTTHLPTAFTSAISHQVSNHSTSNDFNFRVTGACYQR